MEDEDDAEGPTESSAKQLTKRFAIWKTKAGKGNPVNNLVGMPPHILALLTEVGKDGDFVPARSFRGDLRLGSV